MADFDIAVVLTLTNEGGFQDSPNDKGNWTGGAVGVGELKGTNMGISAREFPNLDIQNLTRGQAETIYQVKYWGSLYSQIADQLLANKLFDMGVLFGVGTAIKVLQTILGMVSDGVFGPATLASVNKASVPAILLESYKSALIDRAVQAGVSTPADQGYVAGWIRRINL